MARTQAVHRSNRLGFTALAVVMLALFFVHVQTQVGPPFIHHRQGPVYRTPWQFFAEHLDRPGGLVEYAGAFLTEFHALGWPGAAVLTGLAGCILLATRALLTRFGRRTGALAVVPVLFLLVLANQYEHPVTTGLGLLAALVTANVYVWAAPRPTGLRAGVFLVLASALYVAAAGPMLLFAALAAEYELLGVGREEPAPRERLAGLAYLAVGTALPYLGAACVYVVDPLEAFTRHLPFMASQDMVAFAAAVGLYAFFPVAAAWAAIRPRAVDRPRGRHAALWRWTAGVLLLAAAAMLALGTLDGRERSLLAFDYFVASGRWDDALAEARGLRAWNDNTQHGITRALYRTGRLLDEAFAYPVGTEGNTPPALRAFYDATTYDRSSQTLLEFGRVNEAEHMACEALEVQGELPPIIERLVVIHLLKGQSEAARRFLAVLDQTLWHRDRARRYRQALEADPALAADPDIRYLRSLMPRADRVVGPGGDEDLRLLLQTNPRNHMAFEYLMLHHLLRRQSDLVIADLGNIRAFNYAQLPRHIEEAVLDYVQSRRVRQVNLAGHRVRPETLRRHEAFLARLLAHKGDPAGAWNALKDDFGDTYWFYGTFGCTAFGRAGPPTPQREGAGP